MPFYTQISGTSMATPFVAGVVGADARRRHPRSRPTDETDLRLDGVANAGLRRVQVGAGYINAYAAVDSVFKRSKAYGAFATPSFRYRIDTAWGPAQAFTVDYSPQTPGPNSTKTFRFTVDPGVGIIDVRIDYGASLPTRSGNSLGLMLYAPDGTTNSAGITLPILNAPRREVIVRNPLAGEWIAEVRGLRGLNVARGRSPSPVGLGAPERVDGTIFRATLSAAAVPDIAGHPAEAQIRALLTVRWTWSRTDCSAGMERDARRTSPSTWR